MKCPHCKGSISYVALKTKTNFSYARHSKRRAKLKCDSCDYEEVFS